MFSAQKKRSLKQNWITWLSMVIGLVFLYHAATQATHDLPPNSAGAVLKQIGSVEGRAQLAAEMERLQAEQKLAGAPGSTHQAAKAKN